MRWHVIVRRTSDRETGDPLKNVLRNRTAVLGVVLGIVVIGLGYVALSRYLATRPALNYTMAEPAIKPTATKPTVKKCLTCTLPSPLRG